MKCAQCLLEYLNDEEGTPDLFRVHAAETILDGMAVCLLHFTERMEAE